MVPTATEDQSGVPANFALSQNYPNPFNPTTTFSFSVPQSGAVTLTVHNLLWQRVRTVANEHFVQGTHVIQFDATGLPSGVYSYRLEAAGFTATRKMVLIQ